MQQVAVEVVLVANSSMDDDVSNDGSADLLSSPSPSTVGGDGDNNKVDSHDESHSDDDDDIVIGKLDEKLDANAGHCWSCLVNLRHDAASAAGGAASPAATANCSFLYTTHEHPLLNFTVCSVCEERAEAVESDVIDMELADNSDGDNAATEMNACSWCGLQDDELAENDVHDAIPASDLLLCDKCPRAFCVRCVMLSLGGDQCAWEKVREVMRSEEEWVCCRCEPTKFLEGLQGAYSRISCGSPINVDTDDENNEGEENASKDDDTIQKLVEELDYAEYSLEEATKRLDETHLERERERHESELIANNTPLEDLEEAIQERLESYTKKWHCHYDRFSDTIVRLQDELDCKDVGVMEAYYKCRAKERGAEDDDMVLEDCKISADLALERRDAKEGFSKGEFRGASGYKPKDPRVLKLEPEDLNAACLNEIEDVNTMEGAIEQMQSNADRTKEMNPCMNPSWSKSGTTELDIEMFRKKAVKFEELTLGDIIDLDLLEKRCTTDKDDAVAIKKEDSMVIRRKGSQTGRVVKRSESLRALKKQAQKETTKSRLSGDNQEYKPQLPPQINTKMPATIPRVKKRAQLQRSSGGGTGAAYSGQLSPSTRGLIIGDDTAEYEDSDFVLPVANCPGQITVCKPLATLLKEHQEEGLKFCWKNVCSNIMNFKQEGNDDIYGAILAHNMGLGKSFQAVCLLHTLLTHPSLVTPPGTGGSSGGRIIHRALLIAPVNTLANWETEFQKWVGSTSSGTRGKKAIRFYPWNSQGGKIKIVKEWYEYGGILCVSSEKYANACKGFLDADKRTARKKAKEKKSATPTEDDAFLRKALFNPGPDIVVLDEVHSMLKSNTTNIYKVLCGLSTRLRLGLTGSPIQNNLFEYFRMASWVRPNCLGTESNFTRKFHDPIMDGMAADCTPFQAEKQEQVSNEMHSILANFVHRRDADVLRKDLPFLQETIIHVRQSKAQVKLYREFRKYQREHNSKNFFKQYHALRPVSNHPACLILPEDKKSQSRPNTPTLDEPNKKPGAAKTLENSDKPQVAPDKFAWICDICQKAKFRTLDEATQHEETCDGTFDPDSDSAAVVESKGQTNKDEEWWKSFAERAEESDLDIKDIKHGGKVVLLLQILAHCDAIGDKVVVFSQSLPTLSYIEGVLNSSDWGGFERFLPRNVRKQKLGGWRRNQEYLRIDGSVDAKERGDLIDTFHSDTAAGNQSKLFLISTNAGGLGINLTAANRVVLFDSHWNPAVDLQAVYRCYRYGQEKATYCYRLLAEGSMEQKIYSRAAAKTSLSDLVIDQANPERSFTRQEMDLLRVEDTWVSCNACNKWRMLPPDLTADEVANLPDEWYCKDNIHDPARSRCDAEERTGVWMVSYFERRAREEDGAYIQSQESQGFLGEKGTTVVPPAFVEKHQEYTERDEVLQTLLERSEEKKTASTTGNEASSGWSWVSKWDFNFEKTEKLEPTPTEEEAVKSPTKKSPVKKTKVKSERKKPLSPYQNMRRSPRSTAKKQKSSDKKKEGLEEQPVESGSGGKKRRSPEKSAAKVKEESKAPPEKKKKDDPEKKKKDDSVVDLTFDDSDSD